METGARSNYSRGFFYIKIQSNIPTTGTWEKSRLLRPPSGPEPMIESPPS